jgi:hypothetical protein
MGAFRAQGGSAVNYRRTHGSYQIELIQKNGEIVAAYGNQITGSTDCRRVRAETEDRAIQLLHQEARYGIFTGEAAGDLLSAMVMEFWASFAYVALVSMPLSQKVISSALDRLTREPT